MTRDYSFRDLRSHRESEGVGAVGLEHKGGDLPSYEAFTFASLEAAEPHTKAWGALYGALQPLLKRTS